jgi:hypothetical protein
VEDDLAVATDFVALDGLTGLADFVGLLEGLDLRGVESIRTDMSESLALSSSVLRLFIGGEATSSSSLSFTFLGEFFCLGDCLGDFALTGDDPGVS